jgi:small conductance mechanosensitive channel
MPSRDEFFSPAFYRPLIFNGVRIVFIILFAYVATALARRIFRGIRSYVVKVMLKTQGGTEFEIEKRAQTVGDVVRKALVAVIWVVAVIMILQEMNFDVRPLLAGAGVVGLAVGFGAQNLVKDVLAGFFLLLDNQIRINDVVVINGQGGLVEEVNLRTTILRSEDGAVHLFPNGSITKFSNLTRDFSYAVFNIAVNYSNDTDHVISVLTTMSNELMAEDKFRSIILAPLEVMGVDQLADSGVILKARFKTVPMQQWTVAREMNRRIKKTFENSGIEMPFPTSGIQLELTEDLKNLLQDAVKEHRPAVPNPKS